MNIWLVSREYAGIAEAGGVKNVSCSLCESLARLGHKVTLFIPQYACTELKNVSCDATSEKKSVLIDVLGKKEDVFFMKGSMNGVDIVFVQHPSFLEKKSVYTYTQEDEEENPAHKKGEGHIDVNFMNVIFQKAVVFYSTLMDSSEIPYVIHCQDAATAMVPAFGAYYCRKDSEINRKLSDTKYAVTIHNAGPGYHHNFSTIDEAVAYTGLEKDFLSLGLCGNCVEPFIIASKFSVITTVSPEYAQEILLGKTDTAGLSDKYVEYGVDIKGITNGIDFSRYDPCDTKVSLLPYAFDPMNLDLDGKYSCRRYFIEKFASRNASSLPMDHEKFGFIEEDDDSVFIAYHGRVVHQKGIEVMCGAVESLLEKKMNVKFIIAGQGFPELEKRLAALAEKYSGKVVYLKGYDRVIARLSVASADFSLHPSYFEPCGLEDFIAQTYGTIPVAHATGGLKKILDGKTGFLYSPNTSESLGKVLSKLIEIVGSNGRKSISTIIRDASVYIHEKFSWDKVALEYEKLYKEI